jgi:hypothetical protein
MCAFHRHKDESKLAVSLRVDVPEVNNWFLRNPPNPSAGDFMALVIAPAAEPIPITTAAARPGKVRALGASFIDGQGSALEGLSIQACDRPLNVFTLAELDKPEASWRPCHLVTNYHCRGYLKARVGHKFAERGIGSAMREITYEKFSCHISCCSSKLGRPLGPDP